METPEPPQETPPVGQRGQPCLGRCSTSSKVACEFPIHAGGSFYSVSLAGTRIATRATAWQADRLPSRCSAHQTFAFRSYVCTHLQAVPEFLYAVPSGHCQLSGSYSYSQPSVCLLGLRSRLDTPRASNRPSTDKSGRTPSESISSPTGVAPYYPSWLQRSSASDTDSTMLPLPTAARCDLHGNSFLSLVVMWYLESLNIYPLCPPTFW